MRPHIAHIFPLYFPNSLDGVHFSEIRKAWSSGWSSCDVLSHGKRSRNAQMVLSRRRRLIFSWCSEAYLLFLTAVWRNQDASDEAFVGLSNGVCIWHSMDIFKAYKLRVTPASQTEVGGVWRRLKTLSCVWLLDLISSKLDHGIGLFWHMQDVFFLDCNAFWPV